jgi:hypothetical protein
MPDWIIYTLLVLAAAVLILTVMHRPKQQPTAPDDLAAKPMDDVNPSHDTADKPTCDTCQTKKERDQFYAMANGYDMPTEQTKPTATYAEPAEAPDGEPVVMTIPEAIEAGKVDKPAVVAVTKPKMTTYEALCVANAKRLTTAQARAQQAADFICRGATPSCAAGQYGYASADSLRKALNRYGFRLNGQPKEVKADV